MGYAKSALSSARPRFALALREDTAKGRVELSKDTGKTRTLTFQDAVDDARTLGHQLRQLIPPLPFRDLDRTTSVYGQGHPLYYQNVIDVLRGAAEPETDGREGLRSLEVLIAAYISARDGRRVSLPLDY